MPRLSRMVLNFILAFLLVSTAALAQSPSGSTVRPLGAAASASQHLFGQICSFLTLSWGKNGCEFDPNGQCRTGPSTVPSENGCELDPSGRCRIGQSTIQSENGCELDPNGRCIQ